MQYYDAQEGEVMAKQLTDRQRKLQERVQRFVIQARTPPYLLGFQGQPCRSYALHIRSNAVLVPSVCDYASTARG